MRLIIEKSPRIRKFTNKIDYSYYEIFDDYLIVRCYDDHFTVHTNGDLEHYEVKFCEYKDVRYETNDLDFIAEILHVKKKHNVLT